MKAKKKTDQKGLYRKYIIHKADGSPVDPKARYFVLRLDKDPHARKAALAYSDSILHENPKLAIQLKHNTMTDKKDKLLDKRKELNDFLAEFFEWEYFKPSDEVKEVYSNLKSEISQLESELSVTPVQSPAPVTKDLP